MSREAVDFGTVLEEALADSGGLALARAAEADPAARSVVAGLLGGLGVWDLDCADAGELEAAALACRAAGRVALPYPVAQRLAAGPGDRAVAVVGDGGAVVDHGDLGLAWQLVDASGRTAAVHGAGEPAGRKLGRFVTPVRAGSWSAGDRTPWLVLTLQAWTLLGMTQAAADLTVAHVRQREQFGQRLADFQAVRFSLTETAVATAGVEELAKYTLWSVAAGGPDAPADAVALRLAALEAADVVFRIGHQLHGATGFADETDFSWLSRYSQPLRRLPWGRSRTEAELLALITCTPFSGPFAMTEPIQ
jgi:hypothetical protein